MSDFLTQQQQRRRFTRVAVVESEESRGAFSNKKKEMFVFEQTDSEISGYNKLLLLLLCYCYATTKLLNYLSSIGSLRRRRRL